MTDLLSLMSSLRLVIVVSDSFWYEPQLLGPLSGAYAVGDWSFGAFPWKVA